MMKPTQVTKIEKSSVTREEYRLLLVSFTERLNIIRIISARKATRNERKDYEDGFRQ